MTDKERLALLLEWVQAADWQNSDRTARSSVERAPMAKREIWRRITDFVKSEDGIEVGTVNMRPREWRSALLIPDLRTNLSDREIEQQRLEVLRHHLDLLLGGERMIPMPSLLFGVRDGRQHISGDLPDVVLYLAIRLLTGSGLELGTCQAPAASEPGRANAFDRACGRLFIVEREGRRMYCSPTCKQRAKNPKWKGVRIKK